MTTPEIYALGTLTTGVSFAVILSALAISYALGRRRAKLDSDASKGSFERQGMIAGWCDDE